VTSDKKLRANRRFVAKSAHQVSEQSGKQIHRNSQDFVQESTWNSLTPVTCHRFPVTFFSLVQSILSIHESLSGREVMAY